MEAWVRGQREMSQVLGAIGLLDFTLLGRAFETYEPFISLVFQFFAAAVKRGYGAPPVFKLQ